MTTRMLNEPRFPAMPETHVSALWEEEAIPGRRFMLSDGRVIELRSAGMANEYDGPDYLDAEILLDGMTHRGAIEIHTRTSQWRQHGHGCDVRYDDVILHVVMFDDRFSRLAPEVPLLVLSDVLQRPFRRAWADAIQRSSSGLALDGRSDHLSCEALTMALPRGVIHATLQLAAAARLRRKLNRSRVRLEILAPDLPPAEAEAQLLYELTARAMGYGGNEAAMQKLAETVPLAAVKPPGAKRRAVVLSVAAGLTAAPAPFASTPAANTSDPLCVQRFPSHTWRSKGIKPLNRIPRRLEWLASLAENTADPDWRLELQHRARLFQSAHRGRRQSKQRFRNLAELLGDRSKGISDRVTEILVNAVVPYLYLKAERVGDHRLRSAAVQLYLHTHPAPQNRITRKFVAEFGCGPTISSAQQQGMIELYSQHCLGQDCGSCLIGLTLDIGRRS